MHIVWQAIHTKHQEALLKGSRVSTN